MRWIVQIVRMTWIVQIVTTCCLLALVANNLFLTRTDERIVATMQLQQKLLDTHTQLLVSISQRQRLLSTQAGGTGALVNTPALGPSIVPTTRAWQEFQALAQQGAVSTHRYTHDPSCWRVPVKDLVRLEPESASVVDVTTTLTPYVAVATERGSHGQDAEGK